MVDSIGRMSMGRSVMDGRKRKSIRHRTIQKMEQWRDKARINIIQQRIRYKHKVERNKALMEAKKSGNMPNSNPSSKLDEVGFKPKSLHRFQATYSTVSLKPKYSLVKPRGRIYGNKWKKLEEKYWSKQKLNIPKTQKNKLSKKREIHTIELKRGKLK